MNWFETLESKKNFALFSVILLMVATIALTSIRDPRDFDGFWHLKMGQDWIEEGLSPWQDHYSFTFQGSEVDSPPVGFQVLLYGLVDFLGVDGGFKIYNFISMLLVLVMMLWWLKRIDAPVLVYGLILPILVSLLQFRATSRPEMISYSFAILAIILYDRARIGLGVKQMLPIVGLMLVWNNYHSSIFGYVIFFGLFIDLAINQIKQKSKPTVWVKWITWGLILVAVGFANPSLTHPVVAALSFPAEWKALIQEYQSPRIYSNVPSFYIFILLAIVTLFLAWRQRLYGYIFVCGFLLFSASDMARLVAPAGVVVLCVFGYAASQIDYKRLLTSISSRATIFLPLFALIVFLVPLLNGVVTAREFVAQNVVTPGYFPHAMVEYMKDTGRTGRILNEYGVGGFLVYQLSPESQVYIDGRTNILYPLDHYEKNREAFTSAQVMLEEIQKYDVQYVVATNSTNDALLLDQTGLMQLDYADVRYFLYSKENANTPLAGKLWARPYCWTEDDEQVLDEERLIAAVYFTPHTQLQPFLKLLSDYAAAENRAVFIQDHRQTAFWPDPSKRFVGYQALKLAQYEIALEHFSGVLQKDPKDYLAVALAQLRLGEPAKAEGTLADALDRTWEQLEFVDLVIVHALLTEIREQQGFTQLNDSNIEEIATQIEGYQIEGSGPKVFAETFCATSD